jgi:TonB family protein
MRRLAVGFGLTAALTAGALAAHSQPELGSQLTPAQDSVSAAAPPPAEAPQPAPAINPALTNPILGFYPAAARAGGVEGEAVIRCKRDEHLALAACELVSETPAGQGFGAAALAMAAKSPANPRLVLRDAAAQPASELDIHFTMRPPFIAPDVTRMAHLVRNPEIVAKPSDAQVQAAYPPRALDNQVEGGAVIECAVTAGGKLAECHVFDENPTGYGFGQAALDLAADFTVKPRTIDGQAVAGSPVRISVAFSPNDPSAPLSLQTKPAGETGGGGGAGPR